MDYTIRPVTEQDVSAILELMRAFAEYEKLASYFEVTEEKLRDAMFGQDAFVEGLLAEQDGEKAGYAIFYPCFSTFRGQPGFFLEDLYVSEKYRGTGLGELMLRKVAVSARARGFERIDFHVLDWNRSAIGFYEKLGATSADDERYFKFTGEAFAKLAAEAQVSR
jgi:ribosomal protein S18 acetylase RimI-like enzyme